MCMCVGRKWKRQRWELLELLTSLEDCPQFDQGQGVPGEYFEGLFKGDYRQTVIPCFKRAHAPVVGDIHCPAQIAVSRSIFVLGSVGPREAGVNLGVEGVLVPGHVIRSHGIGYLAIGEQGIAVGEVFLRCRRSVRTSLPDKK